jgi:uncharacterized protein
MVNLMMLCLLEPNQSNFLARIINETLENKGKVLITVPAVGKAQEIMLIFNEYMKRKL